MKKRKFSLLTHSPLTHNSHISHSSQKSIQQTIPGLTPEQTAGIMPSFNNLRVEIMRRK
jgi:hypothetical protein